MVHVDDDSAIFCTSVLLGCTLCGPGRDPFEFLQDRRLDVAALTQKPWGRLRMAQRLAVSACAGPLFIETQSRFA